MSVGRLIGPPPTGALRESAGSYLAPSPAASAALAIAAGLAFRTQGAARKSYPAPRG